MPVFYELLEFFTPGGPVPLRSAHLPPVGRHAPLARAPDPHMLVL
jgi:hypothetical protein